MSIVSQDKWRREKVTKKKKNRREDISSKAIFENLWNVELGEEESDFAERKNFQKWRGGMRQLIQGS